LLFASIDNQIKKIIAKFFERIIVQLLLKLWVAWWCNSSALDSVSSGRGFDSQPHRYKVTTLGKLFVCMYLGYQAV